MPMSFFRSYFGNVTFKLSHVEHFTIKDCIKYTSQKWYNYRKHQAIIAALTEAHEDEAELLSAPTPVSRRGELRLQFSKLHRSFTNSDYRFTRTGDVNEFFNAFSYIREYFESVRGFYLADRLKNLLWMEEREWLEYTTAYSRSEIGNYIKKLLDEISEKDIDDAEYHKLRCDVKDVLLRNYSDKEFYRMMFRVFDQNKEINLKELMDARD